MNAGMTTSSGPDPADEAVVLLSDLIRIDTSNPTHPERPAAEWVADRLAEVDIEARIFESEPGRASVVARVAGTDPTRAPLLIHGHLDVVPADEAEWTVHPFSGAVQDGYVWGRGAVDMKHMDAMTLAVLRNWARHGRQPPRDIVLAFVADEEAGGARGAHWLVDNHPDLFADCSEAISEVGGYSVSIRDDLRLYLIQTAEKGIDWLRLHAKGRPGHGSMLHDDNAVTRLAAAVSRIGRHEFPVVVTDTVRRFLEDLGELTGLPIDPDDPEPSLATLGGAVRLIGATLRNTANPTDARGWIQGQRHPRHREATIDARFLPGHEEELLATIDELIGDGIERRVRGPRHRGRDDVRRCRGRRHVRRLRAEDSGRSADPLPDERRHRRQVVLHVGHPLLRIHAAATADRSSTSPRCSTASTSGSRSTVLRFGVRVLDRFLSQC